MKSALLGPGAVLSHCWFSLWGWDHAELLRLALDSWAQVL